MALPVKDWKGQEAKITMMEFRKGPGDVIDRVEHGMTVYVTKNRKVVACLVPADYVMNRDVTEIRPDGSIRGFPPLTLHRDLGDGGYGR